MVESQQIPFVKLESAIAPSDTIFFVIYAGTVFGEEGRAQYTLRYYWEVIGNDVKDYGDTRYKRLRCSETADRILRNSRELNNFILVYADFFSNTTPF